MTGRHAAQKPMFVRTRLVIRWLSTPWAAAVTWVRETVPATAPAAVMDDDDIYVLAALTQARLDVPDTTTDVRPATVQQELNESTLPAQIAVEMLHKAHPGLPRELRWGFADDTSAHLRLDAIGATYSDEDLWGIVAAYAAALGAPVSERPREPADQGFMVISTVGVFRGVEVGVQATVAPDGAAGVDTIYRHFRAEDDTQAFPAVVVEEAKVA